MNREARLLGSGEHQIAYDIVASDLRLEFHQVATMLSGLGGGHTAICVKVPDTVSG